MSIKVIAEKAGVSIATVSRILNGTKAVSPALTARVKKVVEEYGYVPNHAARIMVLRKTGTIGLVIPKVSLWFQIAIFLGISSAFERNGYQVLLVPIDLTASSEIRYINLLRRKQVDGIVLMHETSNPSVLEYLFRTEIPIVLCTINIKGANFPVVGIDDCAAARDAANFLLHLGHKNIGIIRGFEYTVGEKRTGAFLEVLSSHGIYPKSNQIITGDYSMESGRYLMRKLWEQDSSLTAVFCESDEMALGAIRGARELGLKVPEELSILGFDGIEAGLYSIPSLTTIKQPVEEIGEKVADLLIAIIHKKEVLQKHIILPHTLLIRESCAPVRKNY